MGRRYGRWEAPSSSAWSLGMMSFGNKGYSEDTQTARTESPSHRPPLLQSTPLEKKER